MYDTIVSFAPAATLLCFVWWAIGTMFMIVGAALGRIDAHGKYAWYDYRFIIMRSTIMAWITMWCFRSMFNGPLW